MKEEASREERGGVIEFCRDWFISVISSWNCAVSVPKEREGEGVCNGVIGLHWICLFCRLVPRKHRKRSNKSHIRFPFVYSAFNSAPSFCFVHPIRLHMSLRVHLWTGALFVWVPPLLLLFCIHSVILVLNTEMAVRQH